MILGDIIKGIFGARGLTGSVVDVLKDSGILKDPDMILKAEESLRAFEVAQGSQAVELEKLGLQDRESARQREMEVVKATGKKDINLYVLAWTIVGGFFTLCLTLLFKAIPEGQSDIVYVLFGGLVSGFSTVLGYFFGSSKGSAEKTALMARKADKE